MGLFTIVSLVLVGIGLGIGLFASVLLAAMLALGVAASSVYIGLRSGRPALGIRAFLLQCGVLSGIPAGALCAWVTVKSLFNSQDSEWSVLFYGGVMGAFIGLAIALLLDNISRRMKGWASVRTLRRRWLAIQRPLQRST